MTTSLQQTQNRDRLGSCLSALLGRGSRRSLQTPSCPPSHACSGCSEPSCTVGSAQVTKALARWSSCAPNSTLAVQTSPDPGWGVLSLP